MKKILITDGMNNEAIDKLINLGFEVLNKSCDEKELINLISDFDALIIRSKTEINKNVLRKVRDGKLKLIIRAGVGIDNIDIKFAEELGITVKNTPNSSTNSVAELAIAHIFSVARFLGNSNHTMRNGEWNKKVYKGIEVSGKTLGIIGMGKIGLALGNKAESLGMKIIYNDLCGENKSIKYKYYNLYKLLEISDFVSLHIPYDKEKGTLIGKSELEIMKEGAFIINCARGRVIDEEALIEALNSGHISGAGIDVFDGEPNVNIRLVNHPRVSCSPHIGASTIEAQERIGEEVVSIIKDYFYYKSY